VSGLPSSLRLPRRLLRGLALAVILLAGWAALAQSMPAFGLDRADRAQALLATVQVIVPDRNGNPYSSGSGTVLDTERGYILTNYHVLGETERGRLYNDDGLAVIGLNPANLRGVPVFKYYARLVNGDPQIDLAVLQIVAPFDDPRGRLPQNLGLTTVARGRSDDLLIGDPIYVLGFPGLGGDTITYTSGTVSGFLDENRDGREEWIKTDAEVNHGNSGGLAVNDDGAFIGVPSAGLTDVEAAGKISLIRPSDLALTYYDAWTVAGSVRPAETSAPQIARVDYGDSVNRNGTIRMPVARFPSGVREIYASFEYRNLPRADSLTYRWYHEGKEQASGTLARGRNETGTEWVRLTSEQPLPDGFYELELRLDGRQLYRGGVSVGTASPAGVTLGSLVFAEGVSANGTPQRPAARFGNVGEVFAVFTADGLRNGVVLRSVWYFQGTPVLEDDAPWDQGEVSVGWLSITHRDGLPAGDYRLELYVEGELAQHGEFQVTEQTRPTGRATSVNVAGTVYDRDNQRRTIRGATVIFLNPGVTVDDWINADFADSMIHASGVSVRGGDYQLDRRLETGQTYAIVVVHDDYQPVREDLFQVPIDAGDPYILDVPMQAR
jgi:hypothetical protein